MDVQDRLAESIRGQLDQEGRLSCVAAFQIAEGLELEPGDIGRAADTLRVKLNRCQLGLFGYEFGGGRRKLVQAAAVVGAEMAQAIRYRLQGGVLSCGDAWAIASALQISKLDIAAAAEAMGIKISACQLGAF